MSKIQEGSQVWIVVNDPDEDIDCDVRDKIWTEIKVIDAKTGAHIVWKSYTDRSGADTDGDGDGDTFFGETGYAPHKGHWPGASAGWLGADYLEETGRTTGTFVSKRPFQIGTRVDFSHDGRTQAHIVGPYDAQGGGWVEPTDFIWGGYLYADNTDPGDEGDDRVWVSAQPNPLVAGPAAPQFMDARTTFVPGGEAFLPNGNPARQYGRLHARTIREHGHDRRSLRRPERPGRRRARSGEDPRYRGDGRLEPRDLPGRKRGRYGHRSSIQTRT